MNRPATTHSPTFSPLYQQIRALITRSLESGEWKPGDIIPSESDLAERLLVRRQGKGTFVSTHDDPRSFFRFLRLASNEGELLRLQSIPLECWRAKAGPDVARTLALEPGAPINIVRRLMRFGDEPAVYDEIYLPGELFPDLSLDILNSVAVSMYSLFESRYSVRIIRAEERLRAVSADRVSAELLQVAEGSPLLLVERVTYTYDNKPVEWRRGFYATKNFYYHNELG